MFLHRENSDTFQKILQQGLDIIEIIVTSIRFRGIPLVIHHWVADYLKSQQGILKEIKILKTYSLKE